MSAGYGGREIEAFRYLRLLRSKENGFTFTEVLIVSLIFIIIVGALFITLNAGYFSQSMNSAEVELQSEIRGAMAWVIKDLRQAIVTEIVKPENAPSMDHLKFNLGTWNTGTHSWDITSAYIEYSYDDDINTITRTHHPASGDDMVLEFRNVAEAPFYTTYDGQGDPDNELDTIDLSTNKKITVVLRGQKNVRGTQNVSCTLLSEIKIRND